MEFWKPYGRAIKYGILNWQATQRAARVSSDDGSNNGPPVAFLIGCGRSGTTIIGDIFHRHPDTLYFFEPYHLWANIDPSIDVLNLYHNGTARFLLDTEHCAPGSRERFNRLILHPAKRSGAKLVIEKTPFNAVRIGYLEALTDKPKFVHLIRDGVDVARSIGRLSHDHTYRIHGKPMLNRWWGVRGCKWTALAEEGIAHSYFSDEVSLLRNYESKGAYEWVVSVKEVDRWRQRLGERLLEMSYDRMTNDPHESLTKMSEFLGLSIPQHWFEKSVASIDKPRHNEGEPIVLPPQLCSAFNRVQERFGFANRAVPGIPHAEKVSVAMISNEPTPYRVHVLTRLAKELDDVNMHNVFTHTISNPSMPWEMQIGPDLKPVFFPHHHLKANRPFSLRCYPLYRDIRQHFREHDIQLIILLGYNDLTRLALIRWARRAGIPLILAGDSNVFAEGRLSEIVRPLKRQYIRWVLKNVAGLMPMGTCGRAFFRLYKDHGLPEFLFPYEPDYAMLNRPDPEKLAEFRETHQLPEQRRRLLYCGRLVKVKRVDILIDAFVRIATARPQWDLVIAGDGPLRQELESRIPLSLRDRIKWLGFLQFQGTVLCYHSCHMLVLPSEYEPWALVINEAVACNLPVISTSVVGAAVELVRHRVNGLIIPPRSADAMVMAILEGTEEDRLREMRDACAEMMAMWRQTADPVQGMRQALRHFGLTWHVVATKSREKHSKQEPVADTADIGA